MEKKNRPSSVVNEYFRSVTGKMMYVQGDDEDPLDACIEFTIDLVKYELVHVLNESKKFDKGKRGKISLESILYVFRKNRLLLGRLVKLARAASSIRSISKDGAGTADECSASELSDEESDVSQSLKKVSGTVYGALCTAIDSLAFNFSSDELEKDPDPVMDMRQKRMAHRVSLFESDQYERFAGARAAAFSTFNKNLKKFDLKQWLECSSICNNGDFILGFIARETIALLVEDALTVREQEAKGCFKNEGSPLCIQLRHYEEAVRRNLGFRYRGDFLFGFP